MKSNPTSFPKISILIPIYNVEKYLRQCLDSVINQTLDSIEIICINDGSTDHSLDIIQEYAKKDHRIVILNKSNSGYGDSMNQALDFATGEYIGIVESDDWIEPEAFKELYLLAKINHADVVRGNYYQNKAGKDQKINAMPASDLGRVIHPLTHTAIFYQVPAIWSAIYRRQFLLDNGIRFLPTPGASYQDTSFNYKVWSTAQRAYFTPKAYLHYRIDNESSSVNSPGKVLNTNIEYAEIERFLKERGLWSQLAPMVVATKNNAYMWNAYRLKPKLRPEFIKQSRSEYCTAKSEGYFIREFFHTKEQWRFANAMASYGVKRMGLYIRRDKIKLRLRRMLKGAYRRLRPSYAKQVQLNELINDLIQQNNLLEQQFKLLTQQDKEQYD